MRNNYQIGDWVYDSKRSQYPMQVVAVFANGDLHLDFEGNEGDIWECKANEVEPIPITAEILEKNGLKYVEEDDLWICEVGDDWHLEVGIWGEGTGVLIRFYTEDVFRIDRALHYSFNKYIHQLQQALRLCGIDKEIKV